MTIAVQLVACFSLAPMASAAEGRARQRGQRGEARACQSLLRGDITSAPPA